MLNFSGIGHQYLDYLPCAAGTPYTIQVSVNDLLSASVAGHGDHKRSGQSGPTDSDRVDAISDLDHRRAIHYAIGFVRGAWLLRGLFERRAGRGTSLTAASSTERWPPSPADRPALSCGRRPCPCCCRRGERSFWSPLLTGSLVAYLFYWQAFQSVWCFFAAGGSVVILGHFEHSRRWGFRWRRRGRRPLGRFDLAQGQGGGTVAVSGA